MYCELSEFNMMCEYIECVFIEMNHMGHKMIVGVVYRPPNRKNSKYWLVFIEFIQRMPNIFLKILHIV